MNLPSRKKIVDVVKGRYAQGQKPVSWDERLDGLDVCIDSDGNEIKLYSSGDQCTPAPGWEILLTELDSENRYHWTLYGISK